MTKVTDSTKDQADRPAHKSREIEVTPEMIEAGLAELYDHRFGEDVRLVLEDVYRAMAYASHGSVSASCTKPSR